MPHAASICWCRRMCVRRTCSCRRRHACAHAHHLFKVSLVQINDVLCESKAVPLRLVSPLQKMFVDCKSVFLDSQGRHSVFSLLCAFCRTHLWPARWASLSWTASISLRCNFHRLSLMLKSLSLPNWHMNMAPKESVDSTLAMQTCHCG